MAPESSVKYYRDDAALTILGNLTEQNSENTQTLADVSVRLSTLEDSSIISVMGSANSYAAGLVLAGDATHGSEFLRKDGTWAPAPVAGLAPLASPAFTGTPTAPTQEASDNGTKLATTAYVTSAINDLVEGAPGQLSTLDNLAAALGDDANYASATAAVIATKQPKLLEGAFVNGDKTKLDAVPYDHLGNGGNRPSVSCTSLSKVLFKALPWANKWYGTSYTSQPGNHSSSYGAPVNEWLIEQETENGHALGDITADGIYSSSAAYRNSNLVFTFPRAGMYCVQLSCHLTTGIANCSFVSSRLYRHRTGSAHGQGSGIIMQSVQQEANITSMQYKSRQCHINGIFEFNSGDKLEVLIDCDNFTTSNNAIHLERGTMANGGHNFMLSIHNAD